MAFNKWKSGLTEILLFLPNPHEAALLRMMENPAHCCFLGAPGLRLPSIFVLLPLVDLSSHGRWWGVLEWGSPSRRQKGSLGRRYAVFFRKTSQ